MSAGTSRFVLWVLSVVALILLVWFGHKSLITPGVFNWEFVGFFLSLIAYDQCIRADERVKLSN